jgi:hypothetical protein
VLKGALPSGLLARLVPLCPMRRLQSRDPIRRYSCAVTLLGCPLPSTAADAAVNGALKYYPWFQPHLNYTSPRAANMAQPFPSVLEFR